MHTASKLDAAQVEAGGEEPETGSVTGSLGPLRTLGSQIRNNHPGLF